jgi:hypothetical protein
MQQEGKLRGSLVLSLDLLQETKLWVSLTQEQDNLQWEVK